MKKIFCLIILNLLLLPIIAQSNIRLNNYWEKTYFINPAAVNDQSLAEFSMAARKQWLQFPGAPTTFFAAGTIYQEKMQTQYGVKVVQDKIGYTSSTDIDLTYAYCMSLQSGWKLNMGLAVSYQSLSYDRSARSFSTPDDDVVSERLLNTSNFNADMGVELSNKTWKFGAASQNMFSLFSDINKQFANTNFLYAMYRPYNHDYVNVGYGVCGIQYGNFVQMEFNVTSFFKLTQETEAFQLGFFYRTWSEMGAIFSMDLTKALRLSYSYDFNVGGISRRSLGTHELMLTYRFNKEPRCVNCWY